MNTKFRARLKLKKIILTLLASTLAIGNILPFVFMLSSSFKPLGKVFEYPIKIIPDPFIIGNYIDIFDPKYQFMTWYQNTVVMTVSVIALKIFIVTLTAYSFARLRFRGRNALFLIFLAALMIPGDVTLIQRYVIYKYLHLTDTMWALILPAVFDVYFVFLLRQFFISIPMELTESAIIDGCSHFKIYLKIILPLSKPAILTMILFSFVWAWNDYASPYIFISSPEKQMLTVGITMFRMLRIENYAMQMAAASLALIPIMALFLVTQKYFVEGITTSGIKG